MATIATLAVNMIAKTSAFEAKMRRSRKSLYNMQRAALRAQQRLRSMFAVIAAAVAGGVLVAYIKRTMDSVDATGKLADRIGIATEELTALRLAAELSGTATGMMDKSLEIFVRRLGEVKLGTGEAKKALDKLGLTAEDLAKQSPGQAFEIIAKKIQLLPTAADKATAAYFLFGRSGTQLLNLMEDLANRGMGGLIREAEKLGLTFSRLDAAKVEEANDSLLRVKKMLEGALQVAVIELTPLIQAVADGIVEWGTSGEGVRPKVLGVTEALAKGVRGLTDQIVDSGMTTELVLAGIIQNAADLFNVLAAANLGKPIFGWDVDKQAHDMKRIADRLQESASGKMIGLSMGGGMGRIEKFFADLEKQSADIASTLADNAAKRLENAKIGEEMERAGKAAEELAEKEKKHRAEMLKLIKEGYDIFQKTRTPMEQYERTVTRLGMLLDNAAISKDTYGRALRQARASLEKGGKLSNEWRVTERPAFVAIGGGGSMQIDQKQLIEMKTQTKEQQRMSYYLKDIAGQTWQ